jgi:hypothetical protein
MSQCEPIIARTNKPSLLSVKYLMLGYLSRLQVCEELPEVIAMPHVLSALKTRHLGAVVYLTNLNFRHTLRYKFGMRAPYF